MDTGENQNNSSTEQDDVSAFGVDGGSRGSRYPPSSHTGAFAIRRRQFVDKKERYEGLRCCYSDAKFA